MNIRIPLSYLCDLFGQLQLISLVFVKCVLLVSSFIFFLKKGKGHGRLRNTFDFFLPTNVLYFPHIFYLFPMDFVSV